MTYIRDRQLWVSARVFNALRAAAEGHGLESPDQLADAWLSERIDSDPKLIWRATERAKAMKDLDERYQAQFPTP